MTAREFAARQGVAVNTLRYWKYIFDREQHRDEGSEGSLVEVTAGPLLSIEDHRFELELASGRRLRIPSGFEVEALRRLLAVLGETAS
jgi:hypothetical protein